MGQLLVPAMIGAGVGAVGGAATGKNPFKTALLGAAVGAGGAGLMGGAGAAATAGTAGTGAGAGLIGGANLTGAGIASGASAGATGGLFSGLQGVATTPVSFGTGGYASGIGGQVIPNAITSIAPTVAETVTPNLPTSFMNEYVPQNLITQGTELPVSTVASQPATFADGIQDIYRPQFENITRGTSDAFTGGGYNANGGLFGSIKDMFGGLSTSDKVGLGLKSVDLFNQPQQQMQQTPVTPITRGNPDMVSTPLYNVAPNVGRQQGNEIGLPNLLSRMPLSEEEKMRLQQMAQQGYRG